MAPSRKRKASSKQSHTHTSIHQTRSHALAHKRPRLAEEEGNPQLEFWLNAQESCDVKLSIVPRHQLRTQEYSPPALLVYASCQLLSRIPYFATSLSEPWRMNLFDTHPDIHDEKQCMRTLTLECTASASPSDYHLCMQFSMHNKICFSSVDEALGTVRAADHLHFNECVDACMAYLVTAPWSVNDYEAVQHAMSSLGVRPSPDLAAKLAPVENTNVFKDILLHFLRKNSITAFLGQTFLNAPPQLLTPALMEAWTSLSRDPCLYEATDAWIDLSNALLLQGGIAKELQKAFVSVSPSLSRAVYTSRTPNAAVKALHQFFSRALPSTSGDYYEVALGLSCVQRAELLSAWARVVNKLQNEDLSLAFKKLFCTLPPQEPVLVHLVKEHHKDSFFKPCLEWWNTSLIARMTPSPSANKEVHADE